MPELGNPSELIEPWQYFGPKSTLFTNRGSGFPSCFSSVALFDNTAPARDVAILCNASADPVRGPLALYTAQSNGIPAILVASMLLI